MAETSLKHCPYCAEEIRTEAIKCRYCGSIVQGHPLTRGWYRSYEGKRIAGVCAGLADDFGISVTVVRLAFLLGTLVSGFAIIVYLALWVLMPYRPPGPDGTAVGPWGEPRA